jgi:PAS domain S-box-containing protein
MTADVVSIAASHDHRLVALSILISIVAAYAGRSLFERVSVARGRAWVAWLIGGAAADGIGTWSMHYTGILALRLPVPVRLDWRVVVLSLLVGIVGSGVALTVVSHKGVGWLGILAAGIILGGPGISGLHYTAMAAIRLEGLNHHHPLTGVVVLSIVVATATASIALALAYAVGDDRPRRALRNHAGAVLRGMANPIMHYTAMAAVVFRYTDELPHLSHVVSISSLGLLGISVVPAMVLIVALLTSFADRLQEQRALLDELFEQAPQAVALLGVDDRVVRVNREFTRLFGHTATEALGHPLTELIVPDELRDEYRRYAELVAQGHRVDVELVRQRKDRSRVPVAMIRVPVSVPGGQIATYAIFADISERKRADEALRTYPRRLMEAQETERRRVAGELHDEIGQALTAIGLTLASGQDLPPAMALARMAEARSLLEALIGRARNLAMDLRPAMLDDFGLAPALLSLVERYTGQTGVRIDLKQSGLEGRRFDSEIETAAYRIVQEALTNVARHAQAGEATVRLWARSDTLGIQVEDHGIGFDRQRVHASGRSVGLAGMRDRTSTLGGTLTIETSVGSGTCIIAELPLTGRES